MSNEHIIYESSYTKQIAAKELQVAGLAAERNILRERIAVLEQEADLHDRVVRAMRAELAAYCHRAMIAEQEVARLTCEEATA